MIGTTIHWVPVSVLYEIGCPLEKRVIDQTELSFFVSFVLKGFWILIASTKISRSEYSSSHFLFAQFCVLFFDFGDNKLWNDFFFCNLNTTFNMSGIYLWEENHWKPAFLNCLFQYFIRSMTTSFTKFGDLFSAVVLNWRISQTRFWVSSAVSPRICSTDIFLSPIFLRISKVWSMLHHR